MKKLITWATPRQLQKSREFNKWISKFKKPCKFTKGEHEFVEFNRTQLKWCKKESYLIEYHCGCGKKKVEFSDE